MNKLNEDLEVKINEGIAKSFDITAQIFDELNDIDVIYEKYRQRRQQSATTASNKNRSPQSNRTFSSLKKERNIFGEHSEHINNESSTTASKKQTPDNNKNTSKQWSTIIDCFPAVDGVKSDEKLALEIPIQYYDEQSRLLERFREYKIKLSEQQNEEQEENKNHNNEAQSYFSTIVESVSGFIK